MPIEKWLNDWELRAPTRVQRLCRDDVGFIVMSSVDYQHRMLAVQQTWARELAPGAVMFMNGGVGGTVAPGNRGNINTKDVKYEGRHSYYAAQSHQFLGIRSGRFNTEKKWVMLVDDDTLVNVAHVVRWLERFDPNDMLLLGHVLAAYGCVWGGAGMVLSHAAFVRLRSALRSGKMPMPSVSLRERNDVHVRSP